MSTAPRMPIFKALIFDLDGTLVDSSAVVRSVMQAWCRTHNIPFQSVLDIYEGGRTEDTVASVAPHLCAKSEAEEIERTESTTLNGLTPILGADRFVQDLDSHLWAIVTSSSVLTAKLKLEACRIPTPRILITAESVTHGKPHPEPFLTAASKLGVRPEECLVFEDANNGVNAALAAGCKVVIVGGSCRIEHPDVIARIDSFVDATVTSAGNLKLGTEIIEM